MTWYRRVVAAIPELGAVPGDQIGIIGPDQEGGPVVLLAYDLPNGQVGVRHLDFRSALPFAMSCPAAPPTASLVEGARHASH